MTVRQSAAERAADAGAREADAARTLGYDTRSELHLDRFHLVMDVIDRLPQTGSKGLHLKRQLQDKLIEHKHYIDRHGQDMPEIRNWKWGNPHPLDLTRAT